MSLQTLHHQDKNTLVALGLMGLGVLLLFGIGKIILPLIFAVTILAPGLGLLSIYNNSRREVVAPLAIPGVLLAGTGALLIFQSLTGYWESWAYAWTLYGVFLGYGLLLMGKRLDENTLVTIGRGFMMASGIAFAVLGLIFTVLSSGLLSFLIPFAFIVAGAYLLLKDSTIDLGDWYKSSKAKRSAASVEENIRRVQVNVEDDRDVA